MKASTAQRVYRRWEVTCISACAREWLEHRLGAILRRELAVTGERVEVVTFRSG